MWRLKLIQTYDWLLSRRIVGRDLAGNKYYIQSAKNRPDRRIVDYRDGTPATETVPIQWWAWLHGRRDEPPTMEELLRHERDQKALAEKVSALADEDEKERLRGLFPNATHSETTRSERQRAALLQLAMTRDAARTDHPTAYDSALDSDEQTSPDTSAERPTGAGDDFRPGSWVPPNRQ